MRCQHRFKPCEITDYEKCAECGTYHSTCAPPVEAMYTEEYWDSARGLHANIWEQAWNVDMHTENGVSKNKFVIDRIVSARGSVLEIGCAPGRLLYWLKHAARFERVVGVEPAGYTAEIRRCGAFDGEIIEGFFPECTAKQEDGSFDAVIAIDVLEHSHDPQSFLNECFRLLPRDGQLLLMLPLADDPKMASRFFAAKEHVYIHSAKNIRLMLNSVGIYDIQFSKWAPGHDCVSARK